MFGAQALAVDGDVARVMSFNRHDQYGYMVDGRRFRVSRAAYEALPAGHAFRVYDARFSKMVLGMEPPSAVPNTLVPAGGNSPHGCDASGTHAAYAAK